MPTVRPWASSSGSVVSSGFVPSMELKGRVPICSNAYVTYVSYVQEDLETYTLTVWRSGWDWMMTTFLLGQVGDAGRW